MKIRPSISTAQKPSNTNNSLDGFRMNRIIATTAPVKISAVGISAHK
jgi:hypothetical protein